MSKLTQQPKKVFEVRTRVQEAYTYIFLLKGNSLIVQTITGSGFTLKELSGQVKYPVKVLAELIAGANSIEIEFKRKGKDSTLTIMRPIVKQL